MSMLEADPKPAEQCLGQQHATQESFVSIVKLALCALC